MLGLGETDEQVEQTMKGQSKLSFLIIDGYQSLGGLLKNWFQLLFLSNIIPSLTNYFKCFKWEFSNIKFWKNKPNAICIRFHCNELANGLAKIYSEYINVKVDW